MLSLFRFIDWLLALPESMEAQIKQAIQAIEEERKMPYMTSIERMGREEGRAEGLAEGKREALLEVVNARFGSVPDALAVRIAAAASSELSDLLVRASRVQSLDDL